MTSLLARGAVTRAMCRSRRSLGRMRQMLQLSWRPKAGMACVGTCVGVFVGGCRCSRECDAGHGRTRANGEQSGTCRHTTTTARHRRTEQHAGFLYTLEIDAEYAQRLCDNRKATRPLNFPRLLSGCSLAHMGLAKRYGGRWRAAHAPGCNMGRSLVGAPSVHGSRARRML